MNSNQTQPLRSQAAESAVATRTTWQTPSLACLGTVASLTMSSDTQFHALWRHPDLRTPGLVEDQLRAVPSVASRSLSR